jgi:hypothetical protein
MQFDTRSARRIQVESSAASRGPIFRDTAKYSELFQIARSKYDLVSWISKRSLVSFASSPSVTPFFERNDVIRYLAITRDAIRTP